jgi:hypothetical protein
MDAPSAEELLKSPAVQAALDAAWADSLPHDPVQRHEEGGWIYLDMSSGKLSVIREKPGRTSSINLNHPVIVTGSMVVGKFHTHPNPTSEGWNPGPSAGDIIVDEMHGVPDLIRSDQGVVVCGPNSRRGGLSGRPGYPSEETKS